MHRLSGFVPVTLLIAVLLALTGCEEQPNGPTSGETVALGQVPAPVKMAIDRELQGARVESVQKRAKDGKSVYVVSAKLDGQEEKLIVGDDGKLIADRPTDDDEQVDD